VKMSRILSRTVPGLLLALLLPILAACGGGAQQGNPPTPALPTAAVQTPGAAQPTAAPQSTTTAPTAAAPTAAEGQPTPVPGDTGVTGPLKTPYLEYGVIDHLYYTDRGRVLILTNNAGFDWVRQQVHWKDIEGPNPGDYAWGDLDSIVNDVAAHNLKLLISIVKSPDFYNPTNGLPSDPKSLGDFVDAMMQRYGNKVSAVEIWNEQNLARENGGHVTIEDAGRYVEILAEAYRRIKAISPGTFVLAGPPSSTGFSREDVAVPDEDYYRAMYSYKDGMIKSFFDAQAVHPGGAANPPDTLFPDKPNHIENCPPDLGSCWTDDATHYFRHVENVRRFMEEEGVGDHQIWITEFGWATKNNTPGYEFGNFVTMDQQAQYTVDAMKMAYDKYRYPDGSSWMGAMFLWNMNFAVIWGGQGNPEHEEASFGLLNPDWSPRPSFNAVQGFLAQIKQKRGG
jgi:polysaccharide biosynthesis protein PslG